MITSFYFICVSAVLINKVCLQVTVEGVTGGSVVLPCSSAKHDFNPQDIEVHWRHNGSKIVFDIIKGKDSVAQQDQWYKNRAKTFPDEYLRGNFNIRLTALSHADAGKYSCFISHSSEHKTMELIINEATTEYGTKSPEIGTKSTDQETQKPETDVSSSLLWVCIGVLALLIMLIACFMIGCKFKKKNHAALFSPVMMEDKEQRQK